MAEEDKKLKRYKKGVFRFVISIIITIAEIVLIVCAVSYVANRTWWLDDLFKAAAVVMVLWIYSQHNTASMKMPWIILIMAFPLPGMTMYFLTRYSFSELKMRKRYQDIDSVLLPMLQNRQREKDLADFQEQFTYFGGTAEYLVRYSGYPVYSNSKVIYYKTAAEELEEQKKALEKAKDFIFIEYYAIEEKKIWNSILEILDRKMEEGVEVRVIYDDIGSMRYHTVDFTDRMQERGIRCRVFNTFLPGLSAFRNNRDHRKMMIVDGTVAFTGGYNLADEYFNLEHPYGYWKDTGVEILGEAVKSYTVTFLEMWNAVNEKDIDDITYSQFLPDVPAVPGADGFVQPYADTPMDNEHVGEDVYISLAYSARKYIWYVTPYLIITDEMIHALSLAAKKGVDVRIITPGIPDKKIIYSVTRSYYNSLVRNGVKIYEYTPGFCHCKMCVADDTAAVCGTINMDYRSLYHHFENGCLYVGKKAVMDTKADFDEMLAECRDVTEIYRTGRSTRLRIGQMMLRLIAQML